MKDVFDGFKKFILRGNVVDLAVGVMIGAAFNQVVTSFVQGVLMPFIGLVGGQHDFSGMIFTINKVDFKVGVFLNAVISFLIMATVIYFFVILPINKLTDKMKKKEEDSAPDTRKCPFCYTKISEKATRCPACTSSLK